MIFVIGVGFAVLAFVVFAGLDSIRKEAARSANAHFQMAEALTKIASQAATIESRQRAIQIDMLKLSEKADKIRNEELGREVEEMIARGARVLDG
jgi:peroxiredoxin family protein